jgi:hypothetical protein
MMHNLYCQRESKTDCVVFSGKIKFNDQTERCHSIILDRYDPASGKEILYAQRDDAIVVMMLPDLMLYGGEVTVHGTVSRRILANMERINDFWVSLDPSLYKKVLFRAGNVIANRRPSEERRSIALFSGGMDSSYMLLKHKNGLDGFNNTSLSAAVLIQGCDIPLNRKSEFDEAYRKGQETCSALGIPLYRISTTAKTQRTNWEMMFNLIVTNVLHCFDEYQVGLFAADIDYSMFCEKDILRWGSNPVTNAMLSSDFMDILPVGDEATRSQKALLIAQNKVMTQNLRVCWQSDRFHSNCGHCNKCVRTILNFYAVGIKELSFMPKEMLESKTLLENIKKVTKRMYKTNPNNLYFYKSIINDTVSEEVNSDWYKTLRKILQRETFLFDLRRMKQRLMGK